MENIVLRLFFQNWVFIQYNSEFGFKNESSIRNCTVFLTGGVVSAVFSQEHFLWESDSTTCNEKKHMREKGGI